MNCKIVKWGAEDLNAKFPPKVKEEKAEKMAEAVAAAAT